MNRKSVGQNRCVAINLSTNAVRAVEVVWTPAANGAGMVAKVERKGEAPIPPYVWHDVSKHRDQIATGIRNAITLAQITNRTVVACVPRRLVTLRLIRLPIAGDEQLRGMVAYEAQQYIPLPLDQVTLDYQSLDEPVSDPLGGGELQTVLVAAIRGTLIADLMSIFDAAAVDVFQLSVSSLALAENIRDAAEPTAVVDIEPDEIDIAVIANGRIQFTRSTAVKSTEAPTMDLSDGGLDGRWMTLAEEVVRSFIAYQNERPQLPILHTQVCGSRVTAINEERLRQSLGEMIDMPVGPLQSSLFAPGEQTSLEYATAIGMSLAGVGRALAPINLIPHEREQKKRRERSRQSLSVKVGAVVMALAAVAVLANNSIRAQARAHAAMVDANEQMTAATDQLDVRQHNFDKLSAWQTALAQAMDRAHPAVDVLAAVDLALPKTDALWLTQFDFERRGQLTLRGESRTARAVTDLVIGLQRSGAFSNVRLDYLGDSSAQPSAADAQPQTPATGSATAKVAAPPTAGGLNALPSMPNGASRPIIIQPTPPPSSSNGRHGPGGPPPKPRKVAPVQPETPFPAGTPLFPPPGSPPSNLNGQPPSQPPGPNGRTRSAIRLSPIGFRQDGQTEDTFDNGADAARAGDLPVRPSQHVRTAFIITARINPNGSLVPAAPPAAKHTAMATERGRAFDTVRTAMSVLVTEGSRE